jgi:hypothetical protein
VLEAPLGDRTAGADRDQAPASAPRRVPGRPVRWLVAGLILVRVAAIALLLASGVEDDHSILGGDARRYEAIVGGEGTPYRDFDVEFPPVAVGLMALVDGPTTWQTLLFLAVSQLALELATAAVLRWAWGGRTAVAYLLLGTPMAFFPFPYVRIDFLSVFLAVVGLALLRRRSDVAGGVALAVAVFAKLWPLAVAPSLLVRSRWRGLAAWVATGTAGLVAWVAWAGTAGPSQVVTFRGATGWQIESLPGIVLHLLDPSGSTVQQGAWRTAVAMPGWSRPLLTALSVVTVAAAWWVAARRCRHPGPAGPSGAQAPSADPEDDVERIVVLDGLAPLAAVLGLIVFSPIISPQYLLWCIPFAAVIAARGHRTLTGLMAGIVVLTTYVLATIHGQIRGDLYATVPIVVRNVGLVVVLGLCLRALAITPTPSSAPGDAPMDRQGVSWRRSV